MVEPGDFVLGGGGYSTADSATRGLGLEPFPTECVQTGGVAVFNAGEQIEVLEAEFLDLVCVYTRATATRQCSP